LSAKSSAKSNISFSPSTLTSNKSSRLINGLIYLISSLSRISVICDQLNEYRSKLKFLNYYKETKTIQILRILQQSTVKSNPSKGVYGVLLRFNFLVFFFILFFISFLFFFYY
jgi:hypothetical protein